MTARAVWCHTCHRTEQPGQTWDTGRCPDCGSPAFGPVYCRLCGTELMWHSDSELWRKVIYGGGGISRGSAVCTERPGGPTHVALPDLTDKTELDKWLNEP